MSRQIRIYPGLEVAPLRQLREDLVPSLKVEVVAMGKSLEIGPKDWVLLRVVKGQEAPASYQDLVRHPSHFEFVDNVDRGLFPSVDALIPGYTKFCSRAELVELIVLPARLAASARTEALTWVERISLMLNETFWALTGPRLIQPGQSGGPVLVASGQGFKLMGIVAWASQESPGITRAAFMAPSSEFATTVEQLRSR